MDKHRYDRLYRDGQEIKSCVVCAGLYPATRRRLAREIETLPVCSDRCSGVYVARRLAETQRAAEQEQADDLARAAHATELVELPSR